MQPKPLHRTCTAHVLDMYANENLMLSIVGSTQSFLFSGSDGGGVFSGFLQISLAFNLFYTLMLVEVDSESEN